jgi:hypothetical protein
MSPDQDDPEERDQAVLRLDPPALEGDRAHHRGEDQQGHAVADAPLGDQLAHPHEQGDAGGEREHDEHHAGDGEVGDEVDPRVTEEAATPVVEQERQAGRLQQRQHHGDVAGPLGQLLLADRPLLAPLLELRDHHAEDLHDDRAGDVRHDPEPEDGHAGQAAPREQAEEPEHPALGRLLLELLHRLEVDPRRRDVGPEAVQGDDEEGEQDLVPEVGDPEHVPEAGQHRWLLAGWAAAGSDRPLGGDAVRTGGGLR